VLPGGMRAREAAFPAPGSLGSRGERCHIAFCSSHLHGVCQHPLNPGVSPGLGRVPGGRSPSWGSGATGEGCASSSRDGVYSFSIPRWVMGKGRKHRNAHRRGPKSSSGGSGGVAGAGHVQGLGHVTGIRPLLAARHPTLPLGGP